MVFAHCGVGARVVLAGRCPTRRGVSTASNVPPSVLISHCGGESQNHRTESTSLATVRGGLILLVTPQMRVISVEAQPRMIRPSFDNVDNTRQRNSSKLDMQVSTGDRSLTDYSTKKWQVAS